MAGLVLASITVTSLSSTTELTLNLNVAIIAALTGF